MDILTKFSLKMIITEHFQYSSLREIDNKKLQEVLFNVLLIMVQ